VKYQELENKLRQGDEGQRKNNIIIFGLQEKGEDNYFETPDMMVKWLSESMKVDTTLENIDCVARMGSRRGEHPIFIKFTSFSKKLEVLKNKRNLASFKTRVDGRPFCRE
jgi:hypothetical protein